MSQDTQFQPWALTLEGPNDLIYELAEALGFDEVMEALSVSIFESETRAAGDCPNSTLQALYENDADAKTALSGLNVLETITSTIKQLPATDWVSLSQKGLPPVSAGRFWVYGSHDKGSVPKNVPHTILIDAGLAFGTGHHGTTKGCLVIFEELLSSGFSPTTVLDLGCGAGTLAIASAMALHNSIDILATDIDADSVKVTKENAHINGVGDKITITHADGFHSPVFTGRSFELIFANILAGPLMGLAAEITAAMAVDGKVILSGIIDEMAGKVSEAFAAEGLTVKAYPSLDGWTSLLAVKSLR